MKKNNIKELSGMQTFTLVWFGQLISIIGTAMTKFGLMLWAYETVGKASTVALLGFFNYLPYILLSPISGVIVDRFNRKKIMILADLGAGLMTIVMLILLVTGNLRIWHMYLSEAIASICESFQIPAYSSSITLLIPKDKYSKASGMRSFTGWASQILAPIFGGFLILQIGLKGVMLIDIATFLIAIYLLIIVVIPNPDFKEIKGKVKSHVYKDVLEGFNYLKERKGLFKLMLMYVGINFLSALTYFAILSPMILSRSGNNKMVLATVLAALGIGGVVGSLIVSFWRGPKKAVFTISLSGALGFLLGDILIAVSSNVFTWSISAFLSSLFIPFLVGAHTMIWQSKVEPSVQGRVFSIRDTLQMACMPVGFILGGFLADNIFEPAMAIGGRLNSTFGWLVGIGNGSGMALMFIMTGTLGTLICLGGYASRDVRNIEKDIPDFDTTLTDSISD